MATTKKDDIGYCVYVRVDKILTLKIKRSEFENAPSKLKWIKKLLGEDLGNLEVKQSVYLEGVYKQFSDPVIDIFVDTDGIGKGLERVAVTPKGLELFGNVVVLASDEAETILLNKQQVEVVLKELGFYQEYKKIEVEDINMDNFKHSTIIEEIPQGIQHLVGLLIECCVDEGLQVLAKSKDSKDDNGDMALVMCLHGDPKLIDSCQKMLRNFITSNLGSSKDVLK